VQKPTAELQSRRSWIASTSSMKNAEEVHLLPGSCISVDHYMSSVMGHLPHTFGKERIGYLCVPLFVDHASGKLFDFCQFSNNASETINSKWHLECLARQEGITIRKYQADNGIFASNAFEGECDILKQEYSFSGVGTHHQNGVAERNIKTVKQWAHANMLHFAHHLPSQANV
jgi:hypothetical protein